MKEVYVGENLWRKCIWVKIYERSVYDENSYKNCIGVKIYEGSVYEWKFMKEL